MKRLKEFIVLAASAVFLLSPHAVVAQQRTMEQAKSIAAQSPIGAALDFSKSKSFVGLQGQVQSDNIPYYIFNAGEGRGFVIVSGDERMAPILAYGESGAFYPDSVSDNAKAWLELYASEYAHLGAVGAEPVSDSPVVPEGTGTVEPFLTAKWGQYYPFNELCPEYKTDTKSATGCGATAMAQCMYYYRYPAAGRGSNSYTTDTYGFPLSWDFATHPLQWDQMTNTYPESDCEPDELTAISELFYGCGMAVNMDYDEESGSYHTDVMEGLCKYFGYDEDMAILKREYMSNSLWHSSLTAELDAHRPMIVSARTKSDAGHMFVIHGYKYQTEADPYYYINWGWKGSCDGYYLMPNLTYDTEANSLSEDISVIVGIQPDDGVQEHEGRLIADAVKFNKTTIVLSEGKNLDVSIKGLYGSGLHAFEGEIPCYLVDEDNNKTLLYAIPGVRIDNGWEFNYDFTTTLSSTLPSGTYAVQCCMRATGSSTEVEIPVREAATLIVENAADAFKPQMQASEVAVTKTADRALQVDGTNIMNMDEVAFTGTLQPLITDYHGKFITTAGTTKTLSELPKYTYYPRTDQFTCTLPASLTDGAYRIQLGAQQSGYTGWSKVKKYVIDGIYITQTDIDASVPFWILGGNVTLDAPKATVTFRIDSEILSQTTLTMGDSITVPTAPKREGYTFNGWGEVPAVMGASALDFESSYTVRQYTVTFVADGTIVSEETLDYGSVISEPAAPAKTGHSFTSWGEVPATVPASDVTFTAHYTPIPYIINYVVDGTPYRDETFSYGSEVIALEEPTKEGHTFSGWSEVPATMPDHDVTVTGSFTVNNYHLRFIVDGVATLEMDTPYGSVILKPKTPSKEGYTFGGWQDYAETMPAHDLDCIAIFNVNSYKVTFILDGATYSEETLPYGTAITEPTVDEKEGHTFSGWGKVDATVPAHDVEYSGQYDVNSYTLTYIVDGTTYKTYTIPYGSAITHEEDPEDEDYFYAWDDEPTVMPAHDVEVHATITGVDNREQRIENKSQSYYTLDGHKVNAQSSMFNPQLPKGIYIHNGKKVVIK